MSVADEIFGRLDAWRHLPAYQLERRADVFFALYLADIVKDQFAVGVKFVIPEFPVRIGEIHRNTSINKSFKIDYVIGTENEGHYVLVELKTDMASRREKQDWYLAAAQKAGMRKLIGGVIKICAVTQYTAKYKSLMNMLEKARLVVPDGRSYKNLASDGGVVNVLYIQPTASVNEAGIVSFKQVAGMVRQHSDEFSQRFARSLETWSNVRAGEG